MRHRDPRVLIRLVRVRRRLARLRREGELGHTVGVHLLGVGSVVRVLLLGHLSLRGRVRCFLLLGLLLLISGGGSRVLRLVWILI